MTKFEFLLAKTLEGGSNSLIAIAVGTAEGTRTPDGRKTAAFRGHQDPGNHAHNLGSFSYQGVASSPEEADRQQIIKISERLMPTFIKAVEPLKLPERQILKLWAIACDVFTQSEAACLGLDGFIDFVVADFGQGDLIQHRCLAYINPETGLLDAPGFGNDPVRLRADQKRRTEAVLSAIASRLGGLP